MTFHRNRNNTGELGLVKATREHAKLAAIRREADDRCFLVDEFTAKLRAQSPEDYERRERERARVFAEAHAKRLLAMKRNGTSCGGSNGRGQQPR